MESNVKKNLKRIISIATPVIVSGLLAFHINLNINHFALMIVSVFLPRMIIPKPMHFKPFAECLFWSNLSLCGLIVLASIYWFVAFLLALLYGFATSGICDVSDGFWWKEKGEEPKLQRAINWVQDNLHNERLIKWENKLKENNHLGYMIFKYRFREQLTLEKISELICDGDPQKTDVISRRCDNIALDLLMDFFI